MEDEPLDCMADGTCEDTGSLDVLGGPNTNLKSLPLPMQTKIALQQFSVVVGVALMVAALFFLMIAVDKTIEWLQTTWARVRGKEKADDPESVDPAALVGSFKRYK